MKALTLIPKQIKKDYGIIKYEDSIAINYPAYVTVDFDNNFEIINGNLSVDIKNSKCIVCLWKRTFNMHVTIYK